MLLGRETYEAFAQSWPRRTGDPYADRINSLPKYVALKNVAVKKKLPAWEG